MQNPITTPAPSLLVAALFLVANTLAGSVGAIILWFLSRSKQTVETAKTQADIRSIDSSLILKAYERLDVLEGLVRKGAVEEIRDKQRIAELEWQLSLAEQREKVLNQQIELAHGELMTLRQPRT